MVSKKQIAANRRNAVKSHGPVTPEGMERAAAAPLKSGIYAKTVILPNEDRADFDTLQAEYYGRYRPTVPEARSLVDDLVFLEWTQRRLQACYSQLLLCRYECISERYQDQNLLYALAFEREARDFTRLQYIINSTRQAIHRTREALKDFPVAPVPPATETSENHLPENGTLRQTPDPAAANGRLSPSAEPAECLPGSALKPLPAPHPNGRKEPA
jgi:hypothetical protein